MHNIHQPVISLHLILFTITLMLFVINFELTKKKREKQ